MAISGKVLADNIKSLEHRVDDLIRMCRDLRSENESLRADQEERKQYQTQLLEKNRIARERLVKIVDRLKQIERNIK